MPIAGATAPLTVAGVVTMNTAEFLGVATAIELAAPGSRQIMGVGTSLLDMHATTFSFGALETALMCATGVAVAHYLGVPALAPGLATDAKYGGIQAGYEKALKGLIVAAAGSDLITGGIGLLSGAGIMSLPQIVIDAEMATMIQRLLDGAEVSARDGARRVDRPAPLQGRLSQGEGHLAAPARRRGVHAARSRRRLSLEQLAGRRAATRRRRRALASAS